MSHIDSNRRKDPKRAAAAVLVLLLACIGLAACGSASKGPSTSTNAAATTTATTTGTGTGTTGPKGPNTARFAQLRECLKKNGVTLPQRTPGAQGGKRRPPGAAGGFLGGGTGAGGANGAGGPQLPKGVTRAQYEAAIKKCGGGDVGRFAHTDKAFNATSKAALAKFATCMSQNGVKVPAPNTSGKGPVFDTKGIDTKSAQFKTAETKCQSDLSAAFRHGAGGPGGPGGPGGGGGAPPAGGEAPPAG